MGAGSAPGSPFHSSAEDIRAELKKITSSATFARSGRLARFLSFVAEETLAGRGETLKESVIAAALYSNGDSTDAIVRVDARRLRDKLREYYEESPSDPIVISLPKGTYIPHFQEVKQRGEAVHTAALSRRIWLAAAPLSIAAVSLIAYRLIPRRPAEFNLIPITTYPGLEDNPSLSPDGNFVAFTWHNPTESKYGVGKEPAHIHVKEVKGEAIRQLTDGPIRDDLSSWSPSGQHVAFIRGGNLCYVVSALGGEPRLIARNVTFVAWAADSKALLVRQPGPNGPNGIAQVSIETLELKWLTQAPIGDGDWRFQVSPDGENLALIRYTRSDVSDLYIKPMGRDDDPRRITNWGTQLHGLAWTPDGKEVIYSVWEAGPVRLWRIRADINSPGRGDRLAGIHPDASSMTISRPPAGQPARLAYAQKHADIGLVLVDLTSTSQHVFNRVRVLADSTGVEVPGDISMDATLISFTSTRDGKRAIWICRTDGSGIRKVAPQGGTSAISPDNDSIAFDQVVDGNTDLYVASIAGGVGRRITTESSIDATPAWSHDGQWIYFSSTRLDNKPQIFKIRPSGGTAIQITRNGGFRPRESSDGRFLYYFDRLPLGLGGRGRLMRVPVGGGEELVVLEDVPGWKWDISNDGIVFYSGVFVDHFRFSDRQVIRLGRLPFFPHGGYVGLAVTRDGSTLLANQTEGIRGDLMLIDNFR